MVQVEFLVRTSTSPACRAVKRTCSEVGTKRVLAASPKIEAASAVIEKIHAPEKTKQAQILEGDAKTAAAKLIEKLRFEARVL